MNFLLRFHSGANNQERYGHGRIVEAVETKVQDQSQKFEDQTAQTNDQSENIDDTTLMMELRNRFKDSSFDSSIPSGHKDTSSTRSLGYTPKLSFPNFDCNNCRIWTKRKYIKYFNLCNISEEHKVISLIRMKNG